MSIEDIESVEDLHLHHRSLMRSIRSESALMLQRFGALDPLAPDYMILHTELLDEFVHTGINPASLILAYFKEYHLDDEELQAEHIDTVKTVGEVFRIMNEQRATHNLLRGQ